MQIAKCTCTWARAGAGAAARACSGGRGAETPLRRLLDSAGTYGEPRGGARGELHWATQPYAARVEEGAAAGREGIDPRETCVLLFPGQGSQRVGMGLRLAGVSAARALYDLASNIVGWDVWRVCTLGPAQELETRAQTCVLVTALATLERARDERPAALERVRAVAGFSLGELTALTFAQAFSTETALRLVELRSAAMQAAARARPQGMLTVWLAPDARLGAALAAAREETGAPDAVCSVANHLYPGCKVVAGDEAALAWLEARGREWGVRRAARVRVQGAFHTSLMDSAREAVQAGLAALGPEAVRAPRVRVVSGVDARAYRCARDVRRGVARGVTHPVRWEQTLHALYARPRGDRFPLTLALGPGGALRATLRQVNARAWDASLQVDA